MYQEVRYFTIQSILLFLVPHVTEANSDGQVYSSLMPLEVNSISLATGYEFKHKNQSIYLNKDLCEYIPRRQWPNITLPVPASMPPQPASVGPNTQLIRAMQATHDTAADILRSQGTDPCAVYRKKQVEYILNHVESGLKNVRYVTKSCLQPKSLSHTSGQLIVIALPTSVQPVPNHLETHMPYQSTRGSIQHLLGSTYVFIVAMPIFSSPN